MTEYVLMNMEAPLMSFGTVVVDKYGVISDFPTKSQLVGLLGNALGYDKILDAFLLQELQQGLVYTARMVRGPGNFGHLTDFQSVNLSHTDEGWTTRGVPEGRGGNPSSYKAPHLRYRDYLADISVRVALRADSESADSMAHALRYPERPLFLGRKTCIPTSMLFDRTVTAKDSLSAALMGAKAGERVLWDRSEGCDESLLRVVKTYPTPDEKDWSVGLHYGARVVCEGIVLTDVPDDIPAGRHDD